jgi:CBS-domain-containing membrane protein
MELEKVRSRALEATMTRDDKHLDAVSRQLGAAYHGPAHGGAAPRRQAPEGGRGAGGTISYKPVIPGQRARPGEARHRPPIHHGKWHSRVRDVMTTDVVSVNRAVPFKDIARLMMDNQISGVPVLMLGRYVGGIVTESDLLAARERHAGTRRAWTGSLRYPTDRGRYQRLTAEKLMTAPAVTIHPDATIAAAARQMSVHHVKRLPVVDSDGKLIGLVSRRDLLAVFLVPDADIARQVREVLAELAAGSQDRVAVDVRGGIVTLTARPGTVGWHGSLPAAIDVIWDIDGVLDVIDHMSNPAPE